MQHLSFVKTIGLLSFLFIGAYVVIPQSQPVASPQTPIFVVTVDNIAINQNARTLSFDVVNKSGKDITAYVLKIVTSYSTGSSRPFSFGADYAGMVDYGSLFGTEAASEVPFIPIDRKAHKSIPLPSNDTLGDPIGADISVVAVVYSDNSAEGLSRWVDEIFDARDAKYRETAYWQAQLEENEFSESPIDVMNKMASTLSRPDGPALIHSSRVREAAARSVRQGLEDLVQQLNRHINENSTSAMKMYDSLKQILRAQKEALAKSLRTQPRSR